MIEVECDRRNESGSSHLKRVGSEVCHTMFFIQALPMTVRWFTPAIVTF